MLKAYAEGKHCPGKEEATNGGVRTGYSRGAGLKDFAYEQAAEATQELATESTSLIRSFEVLEKAGSRVENSFGLNALVVNPNSQSSIRTECERH